MLIDLMRGEGPFFIAKTARTTFSFPQSPEEKVAKRNRLY